jgi:hypothetical protein
MTDDNQILVPDSFTEIHTDRLRRRLSVPVRELRARYELCEDLAQQLVASAQHLHFDLGISEDEVLIRIEAGLQGAESGLNPAEGVWVARRLAELLGWD